MYSKQLKYKEQGMRWIMSILGLIAIWYMLASKWQIEDFRIVLGVREWSLFALALVLMPVNWWLEFKKFKVSLITPTPDSVIFRSLLSGISWATVTPLRLGNYAARLSYFERKRYKEVIVATLAGNVTQWLAIVIIGTGFLPFYLYKASILSLSLAVLFCSILIISFVVVLGFKIYKSIPMGIIRSWTMFKVVRSFVKFPLPKIRQLGSSLASLQKFALLRYMVYANQLALLLMVFDNKLAFGSAILVSSTIFLAQTVFPFFGWFGLIGRSTAAALVIMPLGDISSHIGAQAMLLMWIINLFIPSLIGLIIFLNHKHEIQKLG